MIKVILVDDDYLVTEFLKSMIPWEVLGYKVIGSFQDGSQALPFIEQYHPDVIITDIGMPIMNGIQLIKKSKDMEYKFYSVFLTCHDDFNYAQQAIKLNSFDYILKESMEVESIITLLQKLKEEIINKKEMHLKIDNIKKIAEKENQVLLKNKMLEILLENNDNISSWITKHKKDLGLDLDIENCIPILCFIDHYIEIKKNPGLMNIINFQIDYAISQTFLGYGKALCVFLNEAMFLILYFPLQNQESISYLLDIKNLLPKFNKIIQKNININVTSIINGVCKFPNDMTKQLNVLINNGPSQRFYMDHGSTTEFKCSDYKYRKNISNYMEVIQEFETLVLKNDSQGIEKRLKDWTLSMIEHKYSPKEIKDLAINIVLNITLLLNTFQASYLNYPQFITGNIIRAETIKQLEDILLEIFRTTMHRIHSNKQLTYRNEIIQAQKYVLMNLDKKITLGEVADHLHFNPSYFSRLYKKSTNENFIDYVNETKMTKAKILIDKTNESIEKIAENLGFEDKSYFLKMFKKYYGVAPRYYKLNSRTNSSTEEF